MNDRDQKRCQRIVLQYKWARWLGARAWHNDHDREVWGHVKAQLRNKMFGIMQRDFEGYVKRCLGEWKKNEDPKEVLYLAWQAFLFGLDRYRNFERPLAFHFYSYTRYFLLGHYGRQNQVFLPLDDLKDILAVEPTEGNVLFIKLMSVQHYREHIPEKYHRVFDDAFQSLHPAPRMRAGKWNKELGVSQKTYDHIKNVFKDTILYLIK